MFTACIGVSVEIICNSGCTGLHVYEQVGLSKWHVVDRGRDELCKNTGEVIPFPPSPVLFLPLWLETALVSSLPHSAKAPAAMFWGEPWQKSGGRGRNVHFGNVGVSEIRCLKDLVGGFLHHSGAYTGT